MREIKFRAWDGDKLRMCYGIMIGPVAVGSKEFGPVPLKQAIVMQFTDLRDKNGKEIYEGDVVRQIVLNVSFEVKFIAPSWWAVGPGFSDIQNEHGFILYEPQILEVIGNVHENPELKP